MLNLSQVTNLREVLICATLSERPVKIEFKHQPDGNLQRLLVLMQSIQTGCRVEVTSKYLTYIPGIITNNGGVEFEFNCGSDRAIGYYLETLIILSLFGKAEIKVNLVGYTNDQYDQSVDSILNCMIPMIKKFAPEWMCQLKVNRRGFRPSPSGKVYYQAPFIKYLKQVNLISRGPFKKIRGVCSGAKIAPNILNRLVSECRNVFNDYIPDVWIHTDFQKSQKGVEFSNGYAVSLVAESTEGCFIAVDSEHKESSDTPESVGEKGALQLLDEIKYSGCVDTSNQQFALLLMAFSEKRVSKVRLGRISVHTIETLRIIRDILGVTFQIEKPEENKEQIRNEEDQMDDDESVDLQEKIQATMIFSCLGAGLSNISRTIF